MSVIAQQPAGGGDESGFTIVELLVAILVGVVVTGALFSILEVSLRQTARITDRVQATQNGRTAMTSVLDELHSACIAREFAPVKEGSGEKELRFVAAFSPAAVIGTAEAYEHRIGWVEAEGKLIDKTFKAKAGSWPSFEYEATASPANGVLLSKYITPISKENPIFKYFKYSKTASPGSATESVGALEAIKLKEGSTLTAAEAKGVAAVQVGFIQAPSDNYSALNRSAEFKNLTTFAFASPASEATITDGPCQ